MVSVVDLQSLTFKVQFLLNSIFFYYFLAPQLKGGVFFAGLKVTLYCYNDSFFL